MKHKIIIDCDPGIDDSLALMMALLSKDIEVLGITIVAGNAPLEMGFGNAKKVLSHLNRLDVSVYLGANKPLKKPFVNALDTHGKDGLGESFLEEIPGYFQEENAVSFLSKTLKEQKCSLIAIGPLTNIANLIQQDLEAFLKIDRLISMGGTYKAHGNCSPVAEYNYWEDPEAAKIVYETCDKFDKPIHMVGLDVTRKIILTPQLLSYMKEIDPIRGNFIAEITSFYFKFHWEWEHLIGCVINDPLAIAYLLDPNICQGFSSYVQIETDGIGQGQTIVDAYDFYRHKPNAYVLNKVDKDAFFTLFFSILFNKDPMDLPWAKKVNKA